ncbi:MAG: hypothetical protein WBA45_07260 [Microthrixaceae bacterium]
MRISDDVRRLLQVVAESGGTWDVRNIDYAYFSRSDITEDLDLIGTLRDLEGAGLIEDCRADGSGVGWRITALGSEALELNE